jgi:hypothetical protein
MDAQNRCPPMINNIAPMPTQNPWAWVWAPNVGLYPSPMPRENWWLVTDEPVEFEK